MGLMESSVLINVFVRITALVIMWMEAARVRQDGRVPCAVILVQVDTMVNSALNSAPATMEHLVIPLVVDASVVPDTLGHTVRKNVLLESGGKTVQRTATAKMMLNVW